MCVAVIGGLGYIGRHVVQQLLTLGYKVLVIDKNEDRKLVNDLRKFDYTGRQLNFIKLSLPVVNSRFKDLIIANHVNTVINVVGMQDTPAQTLYLTKYIYCYLSTACKKVKSYIHTTAMEDNLGYGYDKRLNLDTFPENWLSYNVVKDSNSILKVGVLRLPEAYGHDRRLNQVGKTALWSKLEAIRLGAPDKIPVSEERVQTEDGSPLRDYCPVFDVAGGIIDMMGYIQNSKGFDFAACDIGSGVNISMNKFIKTYTDHYGVKIVTDPVLKSKPRPCLRGDADAGAKMIRWTRIFDNDILSNDSLNDIWLIFEKQLLKQSWG